MKRNVVRPKICMMLGLFLTVAVVGSSTAKGVQHAYPSMAPLSQYLMADRNAEIALARSAAPKAISGDATILVLGPHGYVTAVEGKNGFVCLVDRSWTAQFDFPEFWNPRLRGPMCLNPQAARSILPITFKRTELALAGKTREQIMAGMKAAVAAKQLPPLEPGAMCYMMSKQGYGGDVAPHWPSHLMFFYSDTDPASWGANAQGSPIIAVADPLEHITQFVITTPLWSDGTKDRSATPHHAGR